MLPHHRALWTTPVDKWTTSDWGTLAGTITIILVLTLCLCCRLVRRNRHTRRAATAPTIYNNGAPLYPSSAYAPIAAQQHGYPYAGDAYGAGSYPPSAAGHMYAQGVGGQQAAGYAPAYDPPSYSPRGPAVVVTDGSGKR